MYVVSYQYGPCAAENELRNAVEKKAGHVTVQPLRLSVRAHKAVDEYSNDGGVNNEDKSDYDALAAHLRLRTLILGAGTKF
jgi:hypothetical protein